MTAFEPNNREIDFAPTTTARPTSTATPGVSARRKGMPKRHVWNSIFDDATSLKNLTVQQCEVRLGRSARRAKMAQKRAALAYFRTGEELILLKAKLAGRKQTRQFQKRAFELTGYDETWVRYLMRAVRKFRYLGSEKQQHIAGLAIRNAIAEIDSFLTTEELRRLEAERPIEMTVIAPDAPPTLPKPPKPPSPTRLDGDDALRVRKLGRDIAKWTKQMFEGWDAPFDLRRKIDDAYTELQAIYARNDRANGMEPSVDSDSASYRPSSPEECRAATPNDLKDDGYRLASVPIHSRPFEPAEKEQLKEICADLGNVLDSIWTADRASPALQDQVIESFDSLMKLFGRNRQIRWRDGTLRVAPSAPSRSLTQPPWKPLLKIQPRAINSLLRAIIEDCKVDVADPETLDATWMEALRLISLSSSSKESAPPARQCGSALASKPSSLESIACQ